MEKNMLEQAVMALLEVVGAHPDFNGPLGKALTGRKVDLSALNVCEETTNTRGVGAMDKSDELAARRKILKFLQGAHCVWRGSELNDCMALAYNDIAELAADEEVALTLKRSTWEGVIKCLREKWHGAAADMLRTQLDATP